MTKIINRFIIIFVLLQLFSFYPKTLFYQSEVDRIEIRQRMQDYPPSLYRLANILEQRPESLLFYRLQNNFFNILNFSSIPFILIPLLIIGIFYQMKTKKFSYFVIPVFMPLTALTLLGPNQPHGNFCLYPFLIISIIYGIVALAKKK
jgi:hypothetical protein